MNKGYLVLALLVLSSTNAAAGKSEPIDAVNTFFDAMARNDAKLASSVVIGDGVFYGYVESAEGLRLVRVTAGQFLEGMANRTDAVLERIWDVHVLVNKRLAMAWTPYDFFLNGEFHHCGVNSFNLIQTNDGWKIAGVVRSHKSGGTVKKGSGVFCMPNHRLETGLRPAALWTGLGCSA